MAASFPSQPPSASKTLNKLDKASKSKKGKARERPLGGTAKPRDVQESSTSTLRTGWKRASAWNWTAITDPSSSNVPPIYTQDGSYFFSLTGSSVKIHSVLTGQVVSTLVPPPISDDGEGLNILTSAVINPYNAFQLITGSLDGRLMVWDFMDAVLLDTIDIGHSIHFICANRTVKDAVFVVASHLSRSRKDNNAVVLRVSLKHFDAQQNSQSISTKILPVGRIRSPTGLALSPNGAWLVAAGGHKVYVARMSSLNSGFTKYVSPEQLTCLAFHPTEEYFATGDDVGNIRLWYCLNNSLAVNARGVEKKTQTTSLHWHAHAVSSIAFTPNGAYLLSGGEEAVLVIWQLHTGKKEFVPRVGAPISSISITTLGDHEEEYLLRLVDGTDTFISGSSLRISRAYSQVKLDPSKANKSPSTEILEIPLTIHSLSSSVVLPSSHPSSLQFYSLLSSTLISELEVAPSSRVARRDEKPMEPSRVHQVAISPSGDWMATIDKREADDGISPEIYLKIWKWNTDTRSWVLNTRIDRPHGPKKVIAIAFSPVYVHDCLYLATGGEDGRVKILRLQSRLSTAMVKEELWTSRSIFTFRSEIPQSLSWSADASLLAVSLGPYIALYDPIVDELRQTLLSPDCHVATNVYFVGKPGRHLLAIGQKTIVLWDLLAQSTQWHSKVPLNVNFVIQHPQKDSFALFHKPSFMDGAWKTVISIYSLLSPSAVRVHSLPFCLHSVAWYCSSNTSGLFSFVGATNESRLMVFGDHIDECLEKERSTKEIKLSQPSQNKTLFRDIFGEIAFTELNAANKLDSKTSPVFIGSKPGHETVFNAAAYLTPSLDNYFEPLINSFLRPRPTDVHPNNLGQEDDVESGEDQNKEPLILGTQRSRQVGQEEFDLLTKLFKANSLQVASGKPNGVQKSTPHRHPSTSSTHVIQSGVQERMEDLQNDDPRNLRLPTSSSPTPIIQGKKRKKSLI